MINQLKKITNTLLVFLVSIPILLVIALIVAGITLIAGVQAKTAIGLGFLILLIAPMTIGIILIIFYFRVSHTQIIEVKTEAKTDKFVFHDCILMRNFIKVMWLNIKDEKSTSRSWSKTIKCSYYKFMVNEFKPFWGQKIKVNYGLEAHDIFINAELKNLMINLI